jgi:hypothetical protein
MRMAGVIERYPEIEFGRQVPRKPRLVGGSFTLFVPPQHHGLMGRILLLAEDITAFFHKPYVSSSSAKDELHGKENQFPYPPETKGSIVNSSPS